MRTLRGLSGDTAGEPGCERMTLTGFLNRSSRLFVALLVASLAILMGGCSPDSSSSAGKDGVDGPGGETATKVLKTDEEWRQLLTPEQYEVTPYEGDRAALHGEVL